MKPFCLLVLAFGLASAVPTVDEQALREIRANGKTTVILRFKGDGNPEVRAKFHEEHRPLERSVHPNVLPTMLMENANKVQAKTLDFFAGRAQAKASGSNINQLWITNELVVYDADLELIQELMKNEDIEHIDANREYQLIDGVMDREATTEAPHAWDETTSDLHLIDGIQQQKNQWGVDRVRAPEVWEAGFNGSGVVVGIIDTGVRRTHEILKNNYRQEYGFWDATNTYIFFPPTESYDDNGHGTHCAGTVLGANGYGVAPGAQWIACKGLTRIGSGSEASLKDCGQFMACPWRGRNRRDNNCSMKPKIISNSWGASSSSNFYKDIVETWISGGQTVIFANGNAGRDGCSTTGSPADYPEVISVGATTIDKNNTVADFSSRGPTKNNTMKPDVAAPGKDISSAWINGDSSYRTISGTSMATPHVAGIAALYLSADPTLTHQQVKQFLQQGAKPTQPTGQSCGPKGDDSKAVPDSAQPNNQVGWGLCDATKAFEALQ